MGLSFKPRYNNSSNNNNNNNSRKNQGFHPATQIVCRSCGGKGHFSKDCKRPRIICFGCREEGHMLRDCPRERMEEVRQEEEETEAGIPEGIGRTRNSSAS
jgi:hypothetical protein